MYRIVFLITILLGTLHCSKAQSVELTGHIKDTIGNNIPNINVYVEKKGQNKITQYTNSDINGYYSLNINESGSFTLNISGLSFKKEQVHFTIDSLFSKRKITNDITLKEEPFKLDEIIINSDRSIIIKKDTISIRVSDFVNGNEDVVEDVLKKLPGIEVASDGNIRVQGKSIERVMVEGDDLFENGYKLLTKNLNADVISKVEILDHFSENPILKGIENSDKVALNLVLKENRKKALFGNANAGYGTQGYYDNKINLISFNAKSKYYFFGNLNNIGNDPTGDINQLIYSASIDNNYIGDGISSHSFINTKSGFQNLNNRSTHSKAWLNSLNGIFNPTKNLKIKGLFFVDSNDSDFFSSSTQQYILNNNSFTNNEQHDIRTNTISIYSKWDATYRFTKDKLIEYVGKLNNYDENQKSQTLFNSESLNENLVNKYWFTDHRLTYTQKIQEKTALQLTGRYIHDVKPQNYFVDAFLFPELFPNDHGYDSVYQEVDSQIDFLGIEATYINNKKADPIEIKIGYFHKNEYLNSNFSLINSQGIYFNQGSMYSNELKSRIDDLYASFKYKYDLNKTSFNFALEPHQSFNSLISKGVISKENGLSLNPSLGFIWKINKEKTFNLFYKYDAKNILYNNQYDGFILNDYRSFNKGLGNIEKLNGTLFLSNFGFGNWHSSFFVNASFIHKIDKNYISSKKIIDVNFDQFNDVLLKDRVSSSSNISIDRFIKKMSSNFKINLNYSLNRYQSEINDIDLREIKGKNYNIGFEIRSVFEKSFNFHVGTKWNSSIVKSINTNSNTNNSSFLDLNFTILKKINIEIKNENYYFGNLSTQNNYFFTDIHTNWKFHNNSMSLKFIVNNLFDTNTFANYYISDISIYSSKYRLIPRYFLLKFDFRF